MAFTQPGTWGCNNIYLQFTQINWYEESRFDQPVGFNQILLLKRTREDELDLNDVNEKCEYATKRLENDCLRGVWGCWVFKRCFCCTLHARRCAFSRWNFWISYQCLILKHTLFCLNGVECRCKIFWEKWKDMLNSCGNFSLNVSSSLSSSSFISQLKVCSFVLF